MKHSTLIYVMTVLGAALLGGCKENEHALYSGNACVYFSETTEKDSMQYSFASGLVHKDTVSIPVRIIGAATPNDRTIHYAVDPRSTAVEGTHYTLLQSPAILPAQKVETTIDVEVSDKDVALQRGSVDLILRLQADDEFELGYPSQLQARLVITGQLVKPKYWDQPLSLYFGSYTKAKHRLCIQIMGKDFPDKFDNNLVGSYIAWGRMVYASLLRNPLYDEETQTTVTADWVPI